MGEIWYITCESFFWTHENRLSDQVLGLCYCCSFPFMHLFSLCFIQHVLCSFSFIKNLYFLKTLITWQEVSVIVNTSYHWFINNIISMKFDCAVDNVYEIIENVIPLAFSIFLLLFFFYNILITTQYSIFCIFVFCILRFLNLIWLFLNLLHGSIYGTMFSRTVCETEYKKEDWIKWDWDRIYIKCTWIQIRWDWVQIR